MDFDPTDPSLRTGGRGRNSAGVMCCAVVCGCRSASVPRPCCRRATTRRRPPTRTAARRRIQLARPDNPVTLPHQGQQPGDRGRTGAGDRWGLQDPQLRRLHGPGRHEGFRAEVRRRGRGHAVQQLRRDAGQDHASPARPSTWSFPARACLSRMVYGELLQPLNHTYVPNLANVWPEYQDPWYDLGAQYTVPYTVYTTGVAYRADRVAASPTTATTCSGTSSTRARSYILDDSRRGASAWRFCATTSPSDINTDDPALHPRGHGQADRTDRRCEGQDRRLGILLDPRGHCDRPPSVVR